MLKSLILSTSDIQHGASRSAYRLHQGLQIIDNISSQMLVRTKLTLDRDVIAENSILTKLGTAFGGLPLKFYPQREKKLFSSQWIPDKIASKVKEINPDIINIHWICANFLQIETLTKFNKPLVWTLHDMWSFTGGCQYNNGCDGFINHCGNCPQLKSSQSWDLSRLVWERKAKAWKNLDLTIVTPSKWLAAEAKKSSLFSNLPIEVIPYGLNINNYRPISQKLAREILQLPQDKKLILFGASPGTTGDPRKGLQLLTPALQHLQQLSLQDEIELVVFGAANSQKTIDLGFKIRYLGQFHDDVSLCLIYSAANVFVAPSIQDNFPNTIMESLACGTPCVAFDIGGMPDMLEHQKNGYLAKPFDTKDLATGISWVIADSERLIQLRHQARTKMEQEFFLELQASRYLSLFQKLTDKK